MVRCYPPFEVQDDDVRRLLESREDQGFSPQPAPRTQNLLSTTEDRLPEEQRQAVLQRTSRPESRTQQVGVSTGCKAVGSEHHPVLVQDPKLV